MRCPSRSCLPPLRLGAAPQPTAAAPTTLTGTLKKVRERRRDHASASARHRSRSPTCHARGEPIGYSIDLCRVLVEAIGERGRPRRSRSTGVPVTSETRIDAVTSGEVDLECGSTTSNVERQKQVALLADLSSSPGTKLLVKKGSPIKSFRDLAGKTRRRHRRHHQREALRDAHATSFKLDITIVHRADHAQSFAMLPSGKADAFATDDVLLYGLIAKNNLRNDYLVVGDFLSYDPYGIMYRKDDPQLKKVIATTFFKLAQDSELEHLYKRWFLRKLPSGDRLDLAISPQLDTIFRAMGTAPE